MQTISISQLYKYKKKLCAFAKSCIQTSKTGKKTNRQIYSNNLFPHHIFRSEHQGHHNLCINYLSTFHLNSNKMKNRKNLFSLVCIDYTFTFHFKLSNGISATSVMYYRDDIIDAAWYSVCNIAILHFVFSLCRFCDMTH